MSSSQSEDRGPALAPFDRLVMFGILEQMLTVGIPLARALRGLREHYPAGAARLVVDALLLHIVRGAHLSEAMAASPRAFTRLQVGVVAAGERGGRLPAAFARLARHEARGLSLTRHVRSVMVYPLVVFAAALLLIVVLAWVLLSGVAPVLAQARIETNVLTSALIRGASALRDVRLVACLGIAALLVAVGTRRWLAGPGSAVFERALLSLPIVGPLTCRVESTHLCESLAALHECGVPLVQSLETVAAACSHEASREALAVAGRELRAGRTLSEALAASGFFAPTVTQMVAVGEQSGTLPRMLARVAEYQDVEVRGALEQFAAALEPLVIAGLGAVVAVIILVAFAPLYRLVAVLA